MDYKYLENKSGVYLIKNRFNNKVYVGSSENVRKRIIGHLSDLRSNRHHSKHLQKSWNKYNNSNFSVHILEYTTIDCLLKREKYWLDFYLSYNKNYGYNLCKFPENTKGRKHSEETKLKISNNRKGLTIGDKNPFYGKKHTKEFLNKISEERKITYKGKNNPNYRKDVLIEDIIEMYNKLKSTEKVCEHFKLTRDTIARRLKIVGLKFNRQRKLVDNHSSETNV